MEKQDEHEEKEYMFTDNRSLRLVTVLQCIETSSNTYFYKNVVLCAVQLQESGQKERIHLRTVGIDWHFLFGVGRKITL